MKTLIYVLQDDNGDIRYVGKTSHSLLNRLNEHILESKKGKMSHKANWIRSCLNKGYLPLIKIIETIDNENGSLQEIYWIDRYKRQGCDLTNATLGGEGMIPSEETRKKMISKATGRKLTDADKKKISISHLGKKLSEEHKSNMSKAQSRRWKNGVPSSEKWKSHIEKMRNLALSRKGQQMSEDARRKMSESGKIAWQKRKIIAKEQSI